MSTGQCPRCRATYGCLCVGSSTNRASWDTVSNPMGALQSIIHEQSNEIRSLRAALDEANTSRERLQVDIDRLAATASDVYCHITNGRLSYPTYDARTIITEADDCTNALVEAETADIRAERDAAIATAARWEERASWLEKSHAAAMDDVRRDSTVPIGADGPDGA